MIELRGRSCNPSAGKQLGGWARHCLVRHRACFLQAQVPPVVGAFPETLMRSNSFVRPSLVAGLLALALPVAARAQARAAAPDPATGFAFEATPYVGYMVFGNYLS